MLEFAVNFIRNKVITMKKIILSLLFIILGGGIGAAVAHFYPPKWQVSAQFEPPKMDELGNYFSLFSTYSLVSGDADAVDMTKIEKKATEAAYQEFSSLLNSPTQLETYLAQSPFAKSLAEIEQTGEQQVVKNLASHFRFGTQNGQAEFTLMSFDRQEVDSLFVDYIRYINQQARDTLNKGLIDKWKVLFGQVKQAADAKIDVSWENKLKMMQSVKPLDNNLVAFRFVQSPMLSQDQKPYTIGVTGGAAAGLIFSLLAMLILRSPRKEKEV